MKAWQDEDSITTSPSPQPRAIRDQENGKASITTFCQLQSFNKRLKMMNCWSGREVYGNYYGVPKQQVRDALSLGKHVIIRVDVQGALRIKELASEAFMIFVHPPSMEVLRRRLERRGVNSEADIATRLNAAADEINQSKAFDRQVVNQEDQLEAAVDEVINIVHNESRRVPPRIVKI